MLIEFTSDESRAIEALRKALSKDSWREDLHYFHVQNKNIFATDARRLFWFAQPRDIPDGLYIFHKLGLGNSTVKYRVVPVDVEKKSNMDKAIPTCTKTADVSNPAELCATIAHYAKRSINPELLKNIAMHGASYKITWNHKSFGPVIIDNGLFKAVIMPIVSEWSK